MKKTIAEAARDLTNRTWIPYQYFEIGTILALNVSTSEDSLQEYALYKKNPESGEFVKFESITVSWLSEEKLAYLLQKYETTSFKALTDNNFWSAPENRTFNIPVIPLDTFARFQAEFNRFAAGY